MRNNFKVKISKAIEFSFINKNICHDQVIEFVKRLDLIIDFERKKWKIIQLQS
jgi:hypothetical protein